MRLFDDIKILFLSASLEISIWELGLLLRLENRYDGGVTQISWNVLGLPQTVTFSSGAVINYSYAADGTKLRESKTAVLWPPSPKMG